MKKKLNVHKISFTDRFGKPDSKEIEGMQVIFTYLNCSKRRAYYIRRALTQKGVDRYIITDAPEQLKLQHDDKSYVVGPQILWNVRVELIPLDYNIDNEEAFSVIIRLTSNINKVRGNKNGNFGLILTDCIDEYNSSRVRNITSQIDVLEQTRRNINSFRQLYRRSSQGVK